MDDVEALRARASALRAKADTLTAAYRRKTWWRFSLVFIPIPFVLVLLRLEIEAWHYFLFGGAYLGGSALLYVWDSRESERCDAAAKEAMRAETKFELAELARAKTTALS
jgi:hypothetical protein